MSSNTQHTDSAMSLAMSGSGGANYSNADEAIAEYVRIRDERDAFRRQSELKLGEFDAELSGIEKYLIELTNTIGVSQVKSSSGTAFKTVKTHYKLEPGDGWNQFSEWLLSSGNVQCLQKRISKTALEEVMQNGIGVNPGELPPGVSIYTELEINVRRPTK